MKIITAIGNEELNNKLKEIDGIEVVGKDISYQEGILEVLEDRNNIDVIAVSNELPEEIDFLFFIDKIIKANKSIDIVVFLKKENTNIENFLNSKKIYKIYYLDENGIEVYLNSLKSNRDISTNISSEIENLKNMIIKKDSNNLELKKECNIITIAGNPGSGKSVISCVLAKQLEKQKRKVVLVDVDGSSSSIKTILSIKDQNDENIIVSKYLKIVSFSNKYSDFISNRSFIDNFIKELRDNYEYVIIDSTSDLKGTIIENIIKYSNKIIYLIEPNILGITKGNIGLEILVNDVQVEKDRIKIVYNKTTKYQIDDEILDEIFIDFERIGSIKFDEKYDSFINNKLNIIDNLNIYNFLCEKRRK